MAILGLLLGAAPLAGQLYTQTIDVAVDSVGSSNSAFSAPGPLANGINAQTQLTFSPSDGVSGSNKFRVGFRLLDESGDPVLLDLGGSTGMVGWDNSSGFTIDIDTNAGDPANDTNNYSTLVLPNSQLDPDKNYIVEVVVEIEGFFFVIGGGTTPGWADLLAEEASPKQFQHFVGTQGDDAVNVLSVLDAVTWQRRSMVTGAAGGAAAEAIEVDVDATLHRFDDWDSTLDNGPVDVTYEVELWKRDTLDGVDDQIPLETPQQTFSESIDSYSRVWIDFGFGSGFWLYSSITESVSHTLEVKPAAGQQLNPVEYDYYVVVTITHEEDPVASNFRTGNTLQSSDERLLHFSGDLAFDDIDTVLENFTNLAESSIVGVFATYLITDLNGAEGHLAGASGYTYGPDSLRVRVENDGTASVVSPTAPVTLNPPSTPDEGTVNGIRFWRTGHQLSHTQGLTADLEVLLPTGMGWTQQSGGDFRLFGELDFSAVDLGQALEPTVSNLVFTPFSGSLFFAEESKPVLMQAGGLEWVIGDGVVEAVAPTGGAIYSREADLAALEVAPVAPEDTFKRSNEHYYRGLAGLVGTDVKIVAGPVGDARLTASFQLGGHVFFTHFPYDTAIDFDSGTLAIETDAVDSNNSKLEGVNLLETRYNQACLGGDCGAGVLNQVMRMQPDSDLLRFTADGGLVAAGDVVTSGGASNILEWGYIEGSGNFHQTVNTAFTRTAFHMPGTFVRGDQGHDPWDGPGYIHFTGFDATDPATGVERPETAAYDLGLADYAGFNYRTQTAGAFEATAILAGEIATYELTERCKYYVRPAGLTGIQEAVTGTFPDELELYDYKLGFEQYGLSYIHNEPEESRTDGLIDLPYPSDFEQDFEEMLFTCRGGLDSIQTPSGSNPQIMRYWLANIDILVLDFASEDGCDPNAPTYLLAGVAAEAAYVNSPLYGTLGFRPNGRLMVPSTSPLNEDSRLQLPSVVSFDGPTRQTDSSDPGQTETELYQLSPVTHAYYNAFDDAEDQAEGAGLLNFAGKLDVAFFEDLEVHMQTSPRNPGASQTVPIRLMGGWSEASSTFFNTSEFDSGNVGFPAGEDWAVYRNEGDHGGDPTDYLIHARQSWLGVINFDYPLQWNDSTRSFKAYESQSNDLLVVSAEHNIDYLSAETAELTIGVTYEGMPTVNITNFVINEVGEATGAYQAMLMAAKEPVVGAIEDGIDDMAEMLSDRMDALYEEFFFTPVEEDVIEPLFDKLEQAAANGNLESFDVETAVLDSLRNDANNLQSLIEDIGDATGTANSLFDEIDGRLEQIDLGLTAIIEGTWTDGSGDIIPDPGGVSPDFAAFLAKDLNGDFQILVPLVEMLLAELAPDISNELNTLLSGAVEDLNSRLNNLFEEAKPTIDQLVNVLTDLRSVVREVRSAIAPAGDLLEEIHAIVEKAKGAGDEITTMLDDIAAEIENFVATVQNSQEFLDTAEEDIKARFRQAVKDNFYASNFVAQIQVTLKQHLYDVDAAINSAISQVFAEINEVTKDLVSELLSGVDDKINGFLGDIDSVMGAGQLDGYGKFNGDALRMLHIDLYLQLMVPDELELNGYLTIKQLDSEGNDTCSPGTPDAPATEVTVGATDVPADWLSPDLRVSIEGKFMFQSNPSFRLLGMGGSFELTDGEISFESFKITDMGAALMFGASENYLAAKLGVVFNSYEAFGGIYFGQTCSLDPLLLVDKDVAEVLGEPSPTFTGVYVYGECHIPVSEAALGIPATCMFRISAGVGAGAFYFVEGNTLGGKIYASASGEALCVVSIKGEVTLIGLVQSGELSFRGKGRLSGSAGPCPLCVKFGKTATVTFQDNSWDVDL